MKYLGIILAVGGVAVAGWMLLKPRLASAATGSGAGSGPQPPAVNTAAPAPTKPATNLYDAIVAGVGALGTYAATQKADPQQTDQAKAATSSKNTK